jgi:hypothetical protein
MHDNHPHESMIVVNRPFHSSSGKQIEPRQNIRRDEHKQANARESKDGPESGSHPPIATPSDSYTPNRRLQKGNGERQTNKIQPGGFPYAHGVGL